MVVHNLYVRRPRFRPAKADLVSVINPNAELAPSASGQLLQAVPRRDSESTERLHRIYLIELASRDTPKTLRTCSSRGLSAAPVEDVLGCVGCKGQNHKHIIARLSCYFKPLQRHWFSPRTDVFVSGVMSKGKHLTLDLEGSECFRHPKELESRYDQALWPLRFDGHSAAFVKSASTLILG